ncbi:MAG: RsmE family RNA methyltransferase [Planctomycetota bacterium]|nr:RsmE family RNA methyltransferase [Planctomycetota bacterium]
MSNRFFSSHRLQTATQVMLDPLECHHLINVLRVKVGDQIELFDGSGYIFESEIREVTRNSVTVSVQSKEFVDRELGHQLVVGIPTPKGDRQKFLVEKLTELGVTRLILLETTRSSVKANGKTVEKLCRAVIEASKQCGRNRLMQIDGPLPLTQINTIQELQKPGFEKMFTHLCRDLKTSWLPTSTCNKVVLIGPEGGLANEQTEFLKTHDWKPISLGKATLRMETAAIASAALLGNGLAASH